jgi:glycine/sarcosine N-methyltransferase
MDNSIPHLTDEEQLLLAARQFRAKLRPGGALMASIRDYDRLLDEKPTMQLPSFFTDADGRRRIVFQVWDWLDERQYMFHLFIARGREDNWETFHTSALYRGIRRSELSDILLRAGFRGVRWLFPPETEYYQPIVIATAD